MAVIVPGVVLSFCSKPESSSRSTYVGSCTTIGNRSKIIGRRGCGWWARRRDENRREVRRKGNGRAYRASSPAASKLSSNGKLSPTGVPPHPTVLLDVPRPRVPQLTFAKTPRRVSSCTTSQDLPHNTVLTNHHGRVVNSVSFHRSIDPFVDPSHESLR